MQFEARVLTTAQQIQTLILEALDEQDARGQLLARQYSVLSLKANIGLQGGLARVNLLGTKKTFDLLLFAQELHALVSAGLSVVEALEALMERTESGDTRAIMSRLLTQLREGQRLSSALALQPMIFPVLFVGVVQAAEGTSDLPKSLERYISYETRLTGLRHKITSAAIYPAVLLSVGSLVALFLLGYVVPRFSSVYQGSGKPLPWASQLLLGWGTFVSTYAWEVAAVLVCALCFAVWAVLQTTRSGGWWRVLAWLPGAAPRLQILELSRLYLTLGMLLEGGIPVTRAMQISQAVLQGANVLALQQASDQVGQGHRISGAFEQFGLSTPVASRLLRIGEQTGQLGIMFSRTAAFYDSETTRWIERFSKVFEPVLMAIIGIVIGLIVILLYMPIFDLAGSLQS
jgi:general secretion pathway protein F